MTYIFCPFKKNCLEGEVKQSMFFRQSEQVEIHFFHSKAHAFSSISHCSEAVIFETVCILPIFKLDSEH